MKASQKGYVIVRAEITDPVRWQTYAALAGELIAHYGGRMLVRGGHYELAEGEARPRNIVLEFESYARAREYLFSAEYAAARKLREGAGVMDAIVVEGEPQGG